jgi:phenylalanyl-tRNA synthetase beta chain
MKFTLGWLKDHLDTNASLEQISTTLTAVGLEVESIADRSKDLAAFTVAKILQAEKHPEADKLRVCKVQTDVGELQIVCGAANARAGIYVVLAKEGALIPANGLVIKKTKIRGVESNGMLCSAAELSLGTDGAGIIELSGEPKIGSPAIDALGANDPVIEIAITPNRADCLGVRGVARDLAAAGLGTLKPLPDISGVKGSFKSPVNVTITTPHCNQFIGAAIKGVKNAESPSWLKTRLEAIGQKPISALVDITNYITFDLGRPLHVYDIKKLKGNLSVRESKSGESLKALNGKDYILGSGMCVIADDAAPQALGGIIGGEPTGCGMDTTDVFLEVALFKPAHVAANGRALQIDSDARYRFERAVDPEFLETGAKLALCLIKELCGGETSELVVTGKSPYAPRSITLKAERIENLGGVSLHNDKVESILTALGFACKSEYGSWVVTPPSWRADVEGEADLVEEVLRIHGYDHIPTTPLPKLPAISKPALNLAQKRVHLAKRTLASRGMSEAVTWSFLPEAQAKLFGGGNAKLKLVNPISADLDTMRPNLLPNLLEAAKKNAFRGFKDVSLFEVGLQFFDITPEGQRMVACGIRSGTVTEQHYNEALFANKSRETDAFEAKADALDILQSLGLNKADIVTTNLPAWYHPGRSGALTLGGKIVLGYFGEIHPGILSRFDIEGRVSGFEIFLDTIPAPRAKSKTRPALKLSEYQAVERDFAFIVDDKVPAADIIKAINAAEKQLVTDVRIFDVYSGKGVDAGKKSVAVKVTLQSFERTLSDADITTVSNAIVAAANKGFGGQLRQ